MLKENRSLDGLIRDIVQGQHIATQQGVSIENILTEVKNNMEVDDCEVLRWITLLDEKKLIRKVRQNAYVPTNLDNVAKQLGSGVAELIASVEEL